MKRVIDGLYVIRGLVNVYVLETRNGCVLIDAGFPGSSAKILDGLRALGKAPGDVRHILLTHAHPDHIGSAAALQRETGAAVWAHGADAPIIEAGQGFRPLHASPGLVNALLTRFLLGRIKQVEAVKVDHLVKDGDTFPFEPSLTAVHAPGHCAGQLAFLWKREGGVLFTADACVSGFKLPPAVENLDEARRSLAKLSALTFEIACFGHGQPVKSGADERFRRAWPPA